MIYKELSNYRRTCQPKVAVGRQKFRDFVVKTHKCQSMMSHISAEHFIITY